MLRTGDLSAAAARDTSIDVVKGIAITLVVFGHTMGGIAARGWWDPPLRGWLENFIYSFHMPVFFFVSGLFVSRSLAQQTPGPFMASKLRTILYPYILWIGIRLIEQPFTVKFTTSFQLMSPLAYWRKPASGDPSWFLLCLFLCMVLTLLTAKFPVWIRLLLAVAACLLTPNAWPSMIAQVPREWVFVVFGQLVGERIAVLAPLRRRYVTAYLGALLCMQALSVRYLHPASMGTFLRAHALALLLGLTGTAGVFCIARLLRGSGLAHMLAWTGEASIAIYLLHPFFQGGMREAIVLVFHTHRALPHLLLTTAFATFIPALIWHERASLHVGWLFRWGRESRTMVAAAGPVGSPSAETPARAAVQPGTAQQLISRSADLSRSPVAYAREPETWPLWPVSDAKRGR